MDPISTVQVTLMVLASLSLGLMVAMLTLICIEFLSSQADSPSAFWDQEQARRNRLRSNSAWFRSLENPILSCAEHLESLTPWIYSHVEPARSLERSAFRLFQTVFGKGAKLNDAVQVGAGSQPWKPSEVAAAAIITACLSTPLIWMVYLSSFSLVWQLLGLSLVWLCVYRGWIVWFLSSSQVRRQQMRRFLPHAIDSIAMTMSAGDSFRAGLGTVIRDFPQHPFSQELARLRNDLDRGIDLKSSIQSVARHICLPEFDEFVSVLTRIHDHGSPEAHSFVRLARQLRLSHLRYMEEDVGKAEAQMSIPTMLVMVSCMLFVILPFALTMLDWQLF